MMCDTLCVVFLTYWVEEALEKYTRLNIKERYV